VVENRFFT